MTPEGFGLGRLRALFPRMENVLQQSQATALHWFQLRVVSPSSFPVRNPAMYLALGERASTLLVGKRGETSCPVWRVNVQTGTRTAWKTFTLSDLAGVV